MGYPIEFVPLGNPYDSNTGDTLQVQLLFEGKPLADQLVYTDYKATGDGHSHDGEGGHSHGEGQNHEANAGHAHEKGHTHDDANAHSHEGDHKTQEDAQSHSHGKEGEHSHGAAGEHTHESGHSQAQEEAHAHGEDGEHTHGTDQKHSHNSEVTTEEVPHQHTTGSQLRTNDQGTISVPLTADGIWYLRTINLVKSEAEGLTHESNWATLTFEVVHGHGEETHTHDETDEAGIPSYVFWIGSIALLGGLFFFFNRKK